LRALAELATGQTDAAFEDVNASLRLAGSFKDEPLLISFLVRVAMVDMAIQPVWEGLAAHRWNESELVALQTAFESINQVRGFAQALEGERIGAYRALRELIDRPAEGARVIGAVSEESSAYGGFRMLPSGWLYQNQFAVDRFYTEKLLPAMDVERRRVDVRRLMQADQLLESTPATPRNLLCKLLLPAVMRTAQKAALSQTGVDQVVIACALKRYRLAHGQMPEKLDALVPPYIAKLPHDVIDGQPLRYRRVSDNEFVLYSIGWNERDDGGQIVWATGPTPRQDLDKGDWVWFSQPQPFGNERK